MTKDTEQTIAATCHCGAVELSLYLPKGIQGIRRCDCSMCRRRGAIVFSVALENLTVGRGQEALSLYQFNTKTAKHYFCSICGIYTHHQRRSNPHEFSVNTGSIDGFNAADYGEIDLVDGVNHVRDR